MPQPGAILHLIRRRNRGMPQLQNLVLTDRQATPGNHTYIPVNYENGHARLVESTGVPIADRVFSISSPKTSKSGRRTVTMTLAVPVVQEQVINGITQPKVVRTNYVKLEVNWDPASNEAERNDIIGQFATSLQTNKPFVHDTVVKLQGIY